MTAQADKELITIAISKGRVFEESLDLLSTLKISVAEEDLEGRKLLLSTSQPGIRLLVIRSKDVPTYVQYGVAELGIVGKDVLMEFTGGGIYEAHRSGHRKMPSNGSWHGAAASRTGRRLRVATKYVRSNATAFCSQGSAG